jgi:hypothetical protein
MKQLVRLMGVLAMSSERLKPPKGIRLPLTLACGSLMYSRKLASFQVRFARCMAVE